MKIRIRIPSPDGDINKDDDQGPHQVAATAGRSSGIPAQTVGHMEPVIKAGLARSLGIAGPTRALTVNPFRSHHRKPGRDKR